MALVREAPDVGHVACKHFRALGAVRYPGGAGLQYYQHVAPHASLICAQRFGEGGIVLNGGLVLRDCGWRSKQHRGEEEQGGGWLHWQFLVIPKG
jgi:hypothetical protein